jgi:hypothetical protein
VKKRFQNLLSNSTCTATPRRSEDGRNLWTWVSRRFGLGGTRADDEATQPPRAAEREGDEEEGAAVTNV